KSMAAEAGVTLSLPPMKALTALSSPRRILSQSSESTVMVALGLLAALCPYSIVPLRTTMCQVPASRPVKSNWMVRSTLAAFSGRNADLSAANEPGMLSIEGCDMHLSPLRSAWPRTTLGARPRRHEGHRAKDNQGMLRHTITQTHGPPLHSQL